ncbi:uncharacterized protein HMPREF1541_10238 [Cyphellophora europaea CBS 101466]|uniref:CASTOR ACT domain-containing protein n=1 Tax=Cyphellophora europaea (strain CBS 101466) TaxID=1220924 RepID=W2S963_CYPE1|nr:uncharacterized protein HMPREF1541_10238 [Cyphellophora europaea CBS 101466]ETN44568.1 hypothetical protein HMPREF1541_10238 [Cyphellophora europaea CBS 101466]
MIDSVNLVSAQISLLEPRLALIHIPIELYSLFLQPILQLLFGEDHDEDAASVPWTNRHEFLNVSITPEGCSVICTRYLADKYMVPIKRQYENIASGVENFDEDYIVIQVDGQGLDAGQRVLELTSPLAMAGISIFFITTYFSDYILVPSRARRTVTKALEQRGFVFSQSVDAFVSQLSPTLPFTGHHERVPSSPSSVGNGIPSTPPAKDLPELQRRTFTKLKKSNIVPYVDRELRLINCAGNCDDAAAQETLKNDLLQVLLSTSPTKLKRKCPGKQANGNGVGHGSVSDNSSSFISITITGNEPISIFLETRLLERLGKTLLGANTPDPENTLVPITFDLQALPMEATGIVCGVAGCLAAGNTGASKELGQKREECDGALDITFLSTAKAGTVLVKESDLDRAIAALDFGIREVEVLA